MTRQGLKGLRTAGGATARSSQVLTGVLKPKEMPQGTQDSRQYLYFYTSKASKLSTEALAGSLFCLSWKRSVKALLRL